jgi:GTP-binding protein
MMLGSMRVITQFLTSAAAPAHFPVPTAPEVAFLGRSNVGKSSVINSLVGEKIAKTSSTPGRTRTINFFGVRRPGKSSAEVIFADLPGYGYAKVPKEIAAEWPMFIEPYLSQRAALKLSLVLVDANIPPQQSDRQMIEWLRHWDRTFTVVATKADKVSSNHLRTSLQKLAEELGTQRVIPYSARTGLGKDDLWREIYGVAAPA